MSRELTSRSSYPAPVGAVFALRTSQRWVDLKRARLGDGSELVERTERPDGGVDIAVARALPSGVPGFLERFLPADGRVVQREQWGPVDGAGRCAGTWSVDIPGAPATLGGTSTVEPLGDGCVQTILGTVRVSVPLIGGKAEQFIADMTVSLMAKEAELMVASLSA